MIGFVQDFAKYGQPQENLDASVLPLGLAEAVKATRRVRLTEMTTELADWFGRIVSGSVPLHIKVLFYTHWIQNCVPPKYRRLSEHPVLST